MAARRVDWISDSRDNADAEFILLGKRQATLYVFDAQARLRDATPVLRGAAASMHRVRATEQSECRLERLASKTIDDNRVSYGCINVPVAFYAAFVLPTTLAARSPLVYVLPEERSVDQVFGSYDVASRRAPNRNGSRAGA